MRTHFGLIVVGAGSGGIRAARRAAAAGVDVAVIEGGPLGGTCVNVGCVPKKLFVYGSEFKEQVEQAQGYGWTFGEGQFDWPTLIRNKRQEIKRLNGIYQKLLDDSGVVLLRGHAEFIDDRTIQVAERNYTADKYIIATGSQSYIPNIPGRNMFRTSDDMFFLDEVPKKIVVYGGGYIAVEFASIFNGLGVEVHLVYRREQVLRHFDADVREKLTKELAARGVILHLNEEVTEIKKLTDKYSAKLSGGDALDVDFVLAATGRTPRSEELKLERTGVKVKENGAIKVNDYFQTDTPNIYAIGDVIDRYQLTPVAITEAMAVIQTIYHGPETSVDYSCLATAVFSNPEIGTVGLTEEEAREKYGEINIYKSEFTPLKETLVSKKHKVFLKMIVDKASDKVVGLHMVGHGAGEIIQGYAVAMKAGATKKVFDSTVAIHPTVTEEFVTMYQDPTN